MPFGFIVKKVDLFFLELAAQSLAGRPVAAR
jgi:hypothetical protein